MASISTTPDRMLSVISRESVSPLCFERTAMAILIPPSGFRISCATPAAIWPSEASVSCWISRRCSSYLLGEVAQHADRSQDLAPGVDDRGDGKMRRQIPPGPRPRPDLPLPRVGAVERSARVAPGRSRPEELPPGRPGQLGLGRPEEALPGRVHRHQAPAGVRREDAVVDAPHHARQQALVVPRLLLRRPEGVPELLERLDEPLGLALREREAVLHDEARRGGPERGGQPLLQPDPDLQELGGRELVRRPGAEHLPGDDGRLRAADVVVDDALDLAGREDRLPRASVGAPGKRPVNAAAWSRSSASWRVASDTRT